MKLSDVLGAAIASSATWLAFLIVAIIVNVLLRNDLYRVLSTYVLFTAWISGMGILIQTKKRK